MTKKIKNKLQQTYRIYRRLNKPKNQVLKFFTSFMPEIIYRTTKLEGEKVSRSQVASIF